MDSAPPVLRVFADTEEACRAAAAAITATARRLALGVGRFSIALSGGSSPRRLLELLAQVDGGAFPWEATHVFWGDERCVPPDDPASNFGMAAAALLDHVALLPSHIHRIPGELDPAQAAIAYGHELTAFFGASSPHALAMGRATAFDIVLQGIGADGHTASLFPGSPALDAVGWAAAVEAPRGTEPRRRITLTLPALNIAAEGLFLAFGAAKRDAVRAATTPEADAGTAAVPAALVRPAGGTTWFLDEAAAPST